MQRKFLVSICLSVLSLAACQISSPDPLDGTSWELQAIGNSRLMEDTVITLTFENGEVNGSGGCNRYGGEYRVTGGEIMIESLLWTGMACLNPEGVMQQEQVYMQVLGQSSSFELVDGRLQIISSGHEALGFIPLE